MRDCNIAIMSFWLFFIPPHQILGKHPQSVHTVSFGWCHIGAHNGYEKICFFVVKMNAFLARLCVEG